MKKGGVAREIKGCRRRCLHHPAPTSASKRGAKRVSEWASERKRERGSQRREIYTTHHGAAVPHNVPHRASYRVGTVWRAMVCTPHAKLAARGASYQGLRANHANALRYSPRPWIYPSYHTWYSLALFRCLWRFATYRTKDCSVRRKVLAEIRISEDFEIRCEL